MSTLNAARISVIEHVPDDGYSSAMGEFKRVLNPKGICCLTLCNPTAEHFFPSVPARQSAYSDVRA